MEREPSSTHKQLIKKLTPYAPYANFYRFCQLLEQQRPDLPALGTSLDPKKESIRFRPHSGMNFPSGELHSIEIDEECDERPTTIRTTFLGLYGVTSPLPSAYIDDIVQQREGSQAVTDFLDIFNHRLTTQFYRIWKKYAYPASFETGGSDATSRYLLGLVGLGIEGCETHIGTPISRFLALLGVLRLPTRTAEGIGALVKLLAPNTIATLSPHDRLRVPLEYPLRMSCRQPVMLNNYPVLGNHAVDVNSQVLLTLCTHDAAEAQSWFPQGQLHTDFLALLRVYLGARLHLRLQIKIPREFLINAQLGCQPHVRNAQLGRTTVLKSLKKEIETPQENYITVSLGRYQCLKINSQHREVEYGGYFY